MGFSDLLSYLMSQMKGPHNFIRRLHKPQNFWTDHDPCLGADMKRTRDDASAPSQSKRPMSSSRGDSCVGSWVNHSLKVRSAGVPRKPGMTRDGLFKINAGIVRACALASISLLLRKYRQG